MKQLICRRDIIINNITLIIEFQDLDILVHHINDSVKVEVIQTQLSILMAKKELIIQTNLDALMRKLLILKSQITHIIDAISSHGVRLIEICHIMMYGTQELQQDMKL